MASSESSDDSFSDHSEDKRPLASNSDIAAVLEKVDLLWKPPPIPEHAKKGDYKKVRTNFWYISSVSCQPFSGNQGLQRSGPEVDCSHQRTYTRG
jgi:hypothetical protein